MNQITINSYIDYIKSILPIVSSVNLVRITDTGVVSWHTKPCGDISVPIDIIDTYKRSIKVRIKFYKYEKEFLIYIHDGLSPSDILNTLHNKINKEVNNTLIKNNDVDYLNKAYKVACEKLFLNLKLTKCSENI